MKTLFEVRKIDYTILSRERERLDFGPLFKSAVKILKARHPLYGVHIVSYKNNKT